MRLLLIEDEQELAALTQAALERRGSAVDIAATLADADDHLAVAHYDALILDLALPDGDGLSLLRRLRTRGASVPVLVLTAREAPEHRVAGLDAGADDYLVKPFHMSELAARLRALLRRPEATVAATLQLGGLTLDLTTRHVCVADRDAGLTVRETTLLEQLLRRSPGIVTRVALEQALYSFDAQLGSNALEVLVHRLRRKLRDAGAGLCLQTVRGIGYALGPAD